MKSIFGGVYALLLINFLRAMCRKICPEISDCSLPKYLIVAKCTGNAMLLGYTDDYSVCMNYCNASHWSLTISKLTETGSVEMGSKGKRCIRSRGVPLYSVYQYPDMPPDTRARDIRLCRKYGFSEEKLNSLAIRFRYGNYN